MLEIKYGEYEFFNPHLLSYLSDEFYDGYNTEAVFQFVCFHTDITIASLGPRREFPEDGYLYTHGGYGRWKSTRLEKTFEWNWDDDVIRFRTNRVANSYYPTPDSPLTWYFSDLGPPGSVYEIIGPHLFNVDGLPICPVDYKPELSSYAVTDKSPYTFYPARRYNYVIEEVLPLFDPTLERWDPLYANYLNIQDEPIDGFWVYDFILAFNRMDTDIICAPTDKGVTISTIIAAKHGEEYYHHSDWYNTLSIFKVGNPGRPVWELNGHGPTMLRFISPTLIKYRKRWFDVNEDIDGVLGIQTF